MVASKSRISSRYPGLLPLLLILPAVIIHWSPGLRASLVYDRTAISTGEVWRLATGQWVHFSLSHLVCDSTVLAATAWLCGHRGYRGFWLLCLLCTLTVGPLLFVLLPEMAFFGGLSGMAMAGTIYLGLHGSQDQGRWRRFGLGMLVLGAGKLGFDLTHDQFTLVRLSAEAVHPVPMGHIAGATCALFLFLAAMQLRTSKTRGKSILRLHLGP